MAKKEISGNIKTIQILLLLFGIIIIIVGFFATGPSLVQFVADYLSRDKVFIRRNNFNFVRI